MHRQSAVESVRQSLASATETEALTAGSGALSLVAAGGLAGGTEARWRGFRSGSSRVRR